MSDEKIEQEQGSGPHHEMSATPFGTTPAADAATEPAAEAEKPAEEPVVAAVEEPTPEPVAEAPVEVEPVEEELMTMEAAMAASDAGEGGFRRLREGEVVDGIVVHIDREGVLVDVGTKSEGHVKPNELSRDPGANPEDVVSVGERIRVYVVQTDSQEGGPVLSKKRADFENAWDRVEKAHREKEVLKAMVSDRVKGGLVVDLGIRGFVPASHVGSGKLKNLDKFIGQSMSFKVIEVDRERRKVVLSNRLAAEEEYEAQRKDTMTSLTEGQIREGVVRRITDYGAFVDLGGVDGLLHVSEMSWTRINHPSEAVKVGQKIQVMVLKLNLEQGRVSLGLRQILPDPWVEVQKLHRVGDTIKATITRLVPFGAFVAVEGGVEGIIPNAELAHKRISKPEEVVSAGQEVEVKVIDLRPEERRMTMSLRQLQPAPERPAREEQSFRSYNQGSSSSGRAESRTTIGDLIGQQLGELQSSVAPEKLEKKKSRARAAKKEALAEMEALAEFEEEIEGADVVEVEAEVEIEPEVEVEAAETEATETEAVETEAVAEVEAEVAPAEEAVEEPAAESVEAVEEPVAEVVETAEAAAEPAAEEVAAKPAPKKRTRKKAE